METKLIWRKKGKNFLYFKAKNFCFFFREVTREEAEIYSQKNGLFFMEVSAKADTNVQEAFRAASEEVIKKLENGQIDPLSDVKNFF